MADLDMFERNAVHQYPLTVSAAGEANYADDLLETKLAPPIEPYKLLVRPRLEQTLEKIARVRLTLVQTPAGYGKTSLLLQWYQALQSRSQRVGWVSIDTSDSDPASTLGYLATSLSRAQPDLGETMQRLRQNERYLTPQSIINALVNGLKDLSEPLFLFLDDIHLAKKATLDVLQRFVELAPAAVHFVVASREIPTLALAKMRARGELLELGIADLIFTRQEADQFLRDAGHRSLSEDDFNTLELRTEGWITGIKLSSLALRRETSASDLFSSFNGTRRSVADFFAEEVLTAQPAAIQEFLLATSVLDRLTPALCQALTGKDDARSMLDQIEASGLFLLKLDEERSWYRYHHLFSDFLRRRLNDRAPSVEKELRIRASDWFFENGLYINAIEYSLHARDLTRAAGILEACCQDMAFNGRIRLVAQFAKQIPTEILHQCPTVLLTWAWLRTYNLRFEETENLLAMVRANLRETEQRLGSESTHRLKGLLLHREMSLAAAKDDPLQVESLCERLLKNYHEDLPPYLLGTVYSMLIYAQREQYKLNGLDALAARAHGTSKRSGYPLSQIVYYASVGPALLFAGKMDAAKRVLEEGLAEAKRQGDPGFALAALPALPLCEALYEHNELEAAQLLLNDALPVANVFGFVDQLNSGFLTQARIHAAHGEADSAQDVLDQGLTVALDRDLQRLRIALISERIRLLLQHGGATDQAVRYARAAGIPASPELLLPSRSTTTVTEAQAMTWIRIAHKQDRISEARHVARQWRSFVSTHSAVRSLVRWSLLLAENHLIGGDIRTAQRMLREAISQAAPGRMIRTFLDEGQIVHTLLKTASDIEPTPSHPTDVFAAELLNAFTPNQHRDGALKIEQPAAEGLYGKLAPKELEILSLVGSGMRNAEIATKLGMTEGSIKWYLQQVYDKIGTRRRLQAVERARQMGLLA